MFTKGYVSVFPSFSLPDVNHVAIEVHIFDEQRTYFVTAKSAAIE
jgi:hypothetical protein